MNTLSQTKEYHINIKHGTQGSDLAPTLLNIASYDLNTEVKMTNTKLTQYEVDSSLYHAQRNNTQMEKHVQKAVNQLETLIQTWDLSSIRQNNSHGLLHPEQKYIPPPPPPAKFYTKHHEHSIT